MKTNLVGRICNVQTGFDKWSALSWSRWAGSFATLSLGLLLQGCASIVSGDNQPVSVVAVDKEGAQVKNASCSLSNDEGTWYLYTPGSVTVSRSAEALTVICNKENFDPGTVTVDSGVKAMAFGNLIFGGIIGAAIDAGSGAAFDYPPSIAVRMGENIVLKKEDTETSQSQE
jgi:hypothetical protein